MAELDFELNFKNTNNNNELYLYGHKRVTALQKHFNFVRVWFISLHVRAVMPVMSARQPGIFPHACVST